MVVFRVRFPSTLYPGLRLQEHSQVRECVWGSASVCVSDPVNGGALTRHIKRLPSCVADGGGGGLVESLAVPSFEVLPVFGNEDVCSASALGCRNAKMILENTKTNVMPCRVVRPISQACRVLIARTSLLQLYGTLLLLALCVLVVRGGTFNRRRHLCRVVRWCYSRCAASMGMNRQLLGFEHADNEELHH